MYETEFIYKVAPRGGGKTRWLADRALSEHLAGNNICYLTNGNFSYRKFMELFFANYNTLATIHPVDIIEEIPIDSIVLIDDLLSYDISAQELNTLKGRAKKVYITLDGTVYEVPHECNCKGKCHSKDNNEPDFEQLTIFDNYEVSLNG